jgi:hypothetical protein
MLIVKDTKYALYFTRGSVNSLQIQFIRRLLVSLLTRVGWSIPQIRALGKA